MSIREASSRAAREGLVEAARELRHRQTRSEELLWQALRNHQLDGLKFRRQSRTGHYIVDFYCPSRRLVLEVDGGVHEIQRRVDAERQQEIEDMGLRVLRIRAEEVEGDLESVLRWLRSSLTPAAATPLPRSRGRGARG